MRIEKIFAREILDSRGIPTLEAEVFLEGGFMGRAAVPSGASTGQFEALELRDGDVARFQGRGVLTALSHLREKIAPAIIGRSFETQSDFDAALLELDGTPNKSHLGANTILAASLSFARARANQTDMPLYRALHCGSPFSLPVPMMNIINGGVHADNPLSIQEFMIIPHGFVTFADALRAGSEIFYTLKRRLHQKGFSTNVGDEGGFAPALMSASHTLDVMCEAVEEAGYVLGSQIAFGLDVAASELMEGHLYSLPEEKLLLTAEQLVRYYDRLIHDYPILSIEDGFGEVDFAGWQLMTEAFGSKIQLVGDDLFVTNVARLKQGIENNLANAILIKVNQVGSLTEAMQAIHVATQAGYRSVISHRSGETEDSFIADLSVASGAGQIKTGSVTRSDRVAKYNQLLRIEESGEGAIPFAGSGAFEASAMERILAR